MVTAVAFRRPGQTTHSKKGFTYRSSSERRSDDQIPLPEGAIPALVDETTFGAVAHRLATKQGEAM
jgi:hypothetical protein